MGRTYFVSNDTFGRTVVYESWGSDNRVIAIAQDSHDARDICNALRSAHERGELDPAPEPVRYKRADGAEVPDERVKDLGRLYADGCYIMARRDRGAQPVFARFYTIPNAGGHTNSTLAASFWLPKFNKELDRRKRNAPDERKEDKGRYRLVECPQSLLTKVCDRATGKAELGIYYEYWSEKIREFMNDGMDRRCNYTGTRADRKGGDA